MPFSAHLERIKMLFNTASRRASEPAGRLHQVASSLVTQPSFCGAGQDAEQISESLSAMRSSLIPFQRDRSCSGSRQRCPQQPLPDHAFTFSSSGFPAALDFEVHVSVRQFVSSSLGDSLTTLHNNSLASWFDVSSQANSSL